MDEEVDQLAGKTEDLQVEKKSPKNWCDLPVDLKQEVIKYVDFMSSLRLRQTARLERFLVGLKKLDFSKVRIDTAVCRRGSLEIWKLENGKDSLFFRYNKHLAPFVAHILNIGNIDELTIDSCETFMEEYLKMTDSIQVRKLIIFGPFKIDSTALLLSKCPKLLDSVIFWNQKDYRDYDSRQALEYKATDLAKISNTKILEYRNGAGYLDRRQFSEVVKAFANRQNTVGTTVKFSLNAIETVLNSPPTLVRNGDRIPTSDPEIEIRFEVADREHGRSVEMHFVPAEPKITDSEI